MRILNKEEEELKSTYRCAVKDVQRRQIERHVEEFLSKGDKITTCNIDDSASDIQDKNSVHKFVMGSAVVRNRQRKLGDSD